MHQFRVTWRFLFFISYTSWIVARIWAANLVSGRDIRRSMRIRRVWARTLLETVGVDVIVTGTPPSFPCIITANHRSYIDPILMLRDVDAFPVAKAEIANWPVIGKGAAMAGILYLRREDARSRAGTLVQIQDVIEQGNQVIIFPEGTTSALPGTLPFKPGVFRLAAKTGIPVVPVAICFHDPLDYWVGEEGFLSHAGRRFREKKIHITLHYGDKLTGSDAEELSYQARKWINSQLTGEFGGR